MAFNFKFLYKIYEKRLFKQIDSSRVPKHIAIIMDGNRRYAKRQKNMKITKGHELGADTLEKVRDWSLELGVDIVTVYAFSTENFNRPEEEVEVLMDLFVKYLKKFAEDKVIHKNQVRIKIVGKTELLPDKVQEAIKYAEEATEMYNNRLFNLAIGYDGRLEIVDAFKNIAEEVKSFIASNKDKIGEVVNVSTTAIAKSTMKPVSKVCEANGVKVNPNEFSCRGAFAVMHKNHPNTDDINNAVAFAKSIVK